MAAAMDPIFRSSEPEDATPKTVRLLWQFFFFPLLIVGACLIPVVIILATRGGAPGPKELLDTVLKGSENAQRQASQQLADAIAKARNDVDQAVADHRKVEAPFFVEPAFAEGLRRAFVQSLKEEKSEDRQAWLAEALGRTADPLAVPLLLDVLYPAPAPGGGQPPTPIPESVRRAAALGLLFLESRAAESALVRASADPLDAQVRAIAMNGLALLGSRAGGAAADGPDVAPALKRGLSDSHSGVQHNAAVALAVRGDAAGLALLERSLARADLEALGMRKPELQSNALVNAVRGLVALSAHREGPEDAAVTARIEGLRGRLEVLAREDGDDQVRQIAREGLERWRKN